MNPVLRIGTAHVDPQIAANTGTDVAKRSQFFLCLLIERLILELPETLGGPSNFPYLLLQAVGLYRKPINDVGCFLWVLVDSVKLRTRCDDQFPFISPNASELGPTQVRLGIQRFQVGIGSPDSTPFRECRQQACTLYLLAGREAQVFSYRWQNIDRAHLLIDDYA